MLIRLFVLNKRLAKKIKNPNENGKNTFHPKRIS